MSKEGAQGAWAPLEIEKQKKKRLSDFGPLPLRIPGHVCMLYCIIYCIIIMFPSFLIHEKTTLCYVRNGRPKKN